MLAALYPTKKQLKAAVGHHLRFTETSIFGSEYVSTGSFNVVGPSASDRRWYATVVMKDDVIARVS